ncbi:MAG: isopeptide-forming domain-containing fimbrial protein [Clostridia bacterium]|nr:isopeptide-forming domain-containing fimbrial protein [Clostridia bacterium]
MKKSNKIFSVVLAIVFVFAMAIPAFADDTGSITISNAINGETYSAYQMLTFTPVSDSADKGVYKVAEGWEAFFSGDGADYFDVNANDGAVTLKEDADLTALAAAAIDYAEDLTATATAKAESATVVLSSLALGYYVVDTSLGTICALTNTNSDVTTIEKNEGPALKKKIVENGDLVDANTAAIGDTVTYQATITIGEGVSEYVMHDKMSAGLTYVAVTSVEIKDEAVDEDYYDITSTELEDGCTFEIAFDSAYTNTLVRGTEIVVTYTATVDADAVVGSTGNPNEAWLEYYTGEVVRTTPVDIVITYTTKLTVNKTNGTSPLKGAGFTLYKNDGENWVAVGSELKADDMTTFVWNGLDEGSYKIVETTVPSGYNKADDIVFTVTCEVPEEVTAVTDAAEWTSESDDITVTDGLYNTTVVNSTGGLLPETGGIGTTIFYIVGALLVVGAVILLITKKRMSAEA